jgi:hypothetical protein
MTKKTYNIFVVFGAFLWGVATFLRGTALMDHHFMMHILWRTPNFGVVWVGIGLAIILCPYIFNKEFNDKYIYFLIAAVLLILLLSEIIHLWLDASFDIWDMVASMVAAIIIIATRLCLQKRRK